MFVRLSRPARLASTLAAALSVRALRMSLISVFALLLLWLGSSGELVALEARFLGELCREVWFFLFRFALLRNKRLGGCYFLVVHFVRPISRSRETSLLQMLLSFISPRTALSRHFILY